MNNNESFTTENVKTETTNNREITTETVKPSNNPDKITSLGVKGKNKQYPNLDIPTTEIARQRGRLGGLKSGETKRKAKTMRETLQNALSIELDPAKLAELGADTELMNGETSVLSAIVASTIREAINGDPRAIQFVRDSIGEQPRQEITQEIITKEDTELLNRLKSSLLA